MSFKGSIAIRRRQMENIEIALEIMGKGMGGIFAAIVVIMLAVMALGKMTGRADEKKEDN